MLTNMNQPRSFNVEKCSLALITLCLPLTFFFFFCFSSFLRKLPSNICEEMICRHEEPRTNSRHSEQESCSQTEAEGTDCLVPYFAVERGKTHDIVEHTERLVWGENLLELSQPQMRSSGACINSMQEKAVTPDARRA